MSGHMDSVKLKIGGHPVTFSKSPTLVAMRAKPAGIGRAMASSADVGLIPANRALGSFQLLKSDDSKADGIEDQLDALRHNSDVAVGTHVFHTSDDGVPFVPNGDIYITYADEASPQQRQEVLDKLGLEVLRSSGERKLVVRVTSTSPNPMKVAATLQSLPYVKSAEPDLLTPGKLAAFALPSDELLNRQWHLRNSGKIDGSTDGLKANADARVVDAWIASRTLGSPDLIMAVIDDGFDLSHPDLSGNGKVVSPWDFTRNNASPTPEFSGAYPRWDALHGIWVGDWHGTACAGVAAGNANGAGIVGVAPNVRLMPVRWGTSVSVAEIVNWFGYVQKNGAAVVSCSWGVEAKVFRLHSEMQEAISRCATQGRSGKGCVVCFAAGNENSDIEDPNELTVNGFAIHPDVIAVAACNSVDRRSHYSNFGERISVCAPSSGAGGRGVVTADVTGNFERDGYTYDSGYAAGPYAEDFGGTSSATPLVAGVAALILSIRPDLTAREVKSILERTARKIGSPADYDANGHSREFGFGCVDAAAAVGSL